MTPRKWSALLIQESGQKNKQNSLKNLGAMLLARFKQSLKLAFVVSAILISALATIPSASAVGLGEITVNSSLNEPLAARVQIINSGDLQDNQILVSLASAEAFERAGVSRDFFLSRLQFSTGRDSSNQRIINIVTQQPVVEPYLDFLVQLQWPEGRVMRAYTMLLDLPIYKDQLSPVVVTPPRASSRADQPDAEDTSSADQVALSGDQHQVIVGDTLWNVAKRLRPRGTTILQTMDSLYEQNATAFAGGDANRLMEGSVLRLPSRDEISEQAGDRVASQIGLVALLDQAAVKDDIEIIYSDEYDSESSPQDKAGTDARLQLVSGSVQAPENKAVADGEDQADAGSRSDSAGLVDSSAADISQQLSSDLAVANDEVNKVQLENTELRERLVLLEAQVAAMAALVDQAQKQADIDRGAFELTKSEGDLSASLLAVPVYFWGALIALILLLAVLLMRRSSASRRDDEALDDLSMGSYESYDKGAPSNATAAATLHELDDLELDPDDDLFDESDAEIFDTAEETVNEEVFEMMVEAVAEAEVYLSLGNTPQAIAVLEDARGQDPADASSRLKLMEILFREGRKEELGPLYEEILLTEDSAAIEMAAIIAGPQTGSVTSLEEGASDLDLNSLELESESEIESSGGQLPELQDLGFSDVELKAFELDDLDMDTLDIQDFDIEGKDSPQESTVLQFPDGGELTSDLDEMFADFDAEPSADEEPSADIESSVVQESLADEESFADIELLADIEPSANKEPSVDQEPSANKEPSADEEPSANKEPSADEEPSANKEPSANNEPPVLVEDAPAAEEFSALDDIDSLDAVDIKLDLAKTYIEMGDPEGAKEILEELLGEADEEGKAKAQTLLDTL